MMVDRAVGELLLGLAKSCSEEHYESRAVSVYKPTQEVCTDKLASNVSTLYSKWGLNARPFQWINSVLRIGFVGIICPMADINVR